MPEFIPLQQYAADFPDLAEVDGLAMVHEHGAIVLVNSVSGFPMREVEFYTRATEQHAAAFGYVADARCPYFEGPYVIDHLTSRWVPERPMDREEQELFLQGLMGLADKQPEPCDRPHEMDRSATRCYAIGHTRHRSLP